MKGNMEERACALAAYIIENRATVRAAAKKFGVSKSTVHKDVAVRLRTLQPELFRQVRAVLTCRTACRSSTAAYTCRSRRCWRSTRPSVTSAAAWPREKNTRDFETFFDFLRLT